MDTNLKKVCIRHQSWAPTQGEPRHEPRGPKGPIGSGLEHFAPPVPFIGKAIPASELLQVGGCGKPPTVGGFTPPASTGEATTSKTLPTEGSKCIPSEGRRGEGDRRGLPFAPPWERAVWKQCGVWRSKQIFLLPLTDSGHSSRALGPGLRLDPSATKWPNLICTDSWRKWIPEVRRCQRKWTKMEQSKSMIGG